MKEKIKTPLTKGQLVEATGCAPYSISYYTACGYLPLIKKKHLAREFRTYSIRMQ